MPFLWVSSLISWLRTLAPWLAGAFGATLSNWLIAVGFSVVVYSGFDVMTSRLIATAVNAFNDLNHIGQIGSDVIALAGYMWLDKALNLLISSGAFLLAIKGVRGGVYASHTWNKPGQRGISA